MAKRNKKQQRKKANIKKRNMARSMRRFNRRNETPHRDEGLSLAEAGMRDMPEILQWSQTLADEPEFLDPIFDPEACMRAFSEQSQALGLDQEEAASWSNKEQAERNAELILNMVEQVLTKREKREITRRLKRQLKRFGDEGNRMVTARINLILSLIEFAEDERVWGAIGLVSALINRQVRGIMDVISTGMNMEVEDGSVDDLLERIKSNPESDRLEEMIKRNPGVLDYFSNKLNRDWDVGMQAIEKGTLKLGLFDDEDYKTFNTYLEEFQKSDGEEEESYDKSDVGPFVNKVLALVEEKMKAQSFRERAVERLTKILDDKLVDADYLSFVLRLHLAFDDEGWLANQANYVMMRSLFADMRPAEDDEDAEEQEDRDNTQVTDQSAELEVEAKK